MGHQYGQFDIYHASDCGIRETSAFQPTDQSFSGYRRKPHSEMDQLQQFYNNPLCEDALDQLF